MTRAKTYTLIVFLLLATTGGWMLWLESSISRIRNAELVKTNPGGSNGMVYGTVVDQDGEPVANIEIQLKSWVGTDVLGKAASDSEGKFSIPVKFFDNYYVGVSEYEYLPYLDRTVVYQTRNNPANAPVRITKASPTATVNIQIPLVPSISGNVITKSDEPAQELFISANAEWKQGSFTASHTLPGREPVNQDGSFTYHIHNNLKIDHPVDLVLAVKRNDDVILATSVIANYAWERKPDEFITLEILNDVSTPSSIPPQRIKRTNLQDAYVQREPVPETLTDRSCSIIVKPMVNKMERSSTVSLRSLNGGFEQLSNQYDDEGRCHFNKIDCNQSPFIAWFNDQDLVGRSALIYLDESKIQSVNIQVDDKPNYVQLELTILDRETNQPIKAANCQLDGSVAHYAAAGFSTGILSALSKPDGTVMLKADSTFVGNLRVTQPLYQSTEEELDLLNESGTINKTIYLTPYRKQ